MNNKTLLQTSAVPSTGRGVDIASRRADDLDRLCVAQLQQKTDALVLDGGCGLGGHCLRMVAAGASVLAVDVCDFTEHFTALREAQQLTKEQLQFVQADLVNLDLPLGTQVSDIVLQRVLHYLPNPAAEQLLTQLHMLCSDRLYISVTGLHTAIGEHYPGAQLPVEQRFHTLPPAQAELFSILEPVCLYTQTEFIDLLTNSGWKIEQCWQSAFGNIKAVCSH